MVAPKKVSTLQWLLATPNHHSEGRLFRLFLGGSLGQVRRRQFLITVGALLVGAPEIRAQHAAKVYRIGYVTPSEATPEPPDLRAFRQGMRELGYTVGKDLILEVRYAGRRPERFPALVADLINHKVDVLVTASNAGTSAAINATSTVPIVFAGVSDAIAAGIVGSLARPGGNVTGSTLGVTGSGIEGKRLELLKEAVPQMSHVAVLFDSANPAAPAFRREIDDAVRKSKVRSSWFDAGTDAAMESAFQAIGASGAQGLIVTGSAFFGGNREKIVRLVAERRIPAIYFFSRFPDVGGLMSYGGGSDESFRKAALQVDKILKGAKPGDLPVDQATRVELVINLKTAKALGITVPQSLFVRADRVIE